MYLLLQWALALEVFRHMTAHSVQCDAVTTCSLISALDKGGQWQMAESVSGRPRCSLRCF